MAWVQLLCSGHPKAHLAPSGSFWLSLNFTLYTVLHNFRKINLDIFLANMCALQHISFLLLC
jgi:hypothetical protein